MCNMGSFHLKISGYGTLRTGRGPTLPIELGPCNMWFVSRMGRSKHVFGRGAHYCCMLATARNRLYMKMVGWRLLQLWPDWPGIKISDIFSPCPVVFSEIFGTCPKFGTWSDFRWILDRFELSWNGHLGIRGYSILGFFKGWLPF